MLIRFYNVLLLPVFIIAVVIGNDVCQAQEKVDQPNPGLPRFPKAIVLPAMEGPKPWSNKPILDDPDRFQIAIVTDNTGGHRPGVWMKAVERLNVLRPSFVMSVGDLIEGYSTDPVEIEKQWNEFLGFIDQMAMRFFFVAGNHDVSNPVMHEHWRKHFGAEWYSFDYKGVHFMALSSEDTSNQIGPEQLAWIEQDLKKSTDSRWTLLFLHKPLWVVSERAIATGNPDETNWKKVESLLGSRPHTVFAGHVHHYVQYDRNGMKYYHLATTGGSSLLRGIQYGEFDHVAWLTMESTGPSIVNLLLDGMVPGDAINEKGITRFRDFLAKTRIEIAPILVDDESGVSEGKIDIRLINEFDVPVEVAASIAGLPLRGLTVEPSALLLQANPGETKELSVAIRFGQKIAFPHLAETLLTAKVRTITESQPLAAERSIPVVIDRKYDCPPVTKPIQLDGQLDDWNRPFQTTGDRPLLIRARDNWQGPGDGSIEFATIYSDTHLYLGAKVTDDNVMSGDKLLFQIDARAIPQRKSDSRLRVGTYTLNLPAPKNDSSPASTVKKSVEGKPEIESAEVVTIKTANGWNMEAAIPLKILTANQTDLWHSFQMTPILQDVDNTGDEATDIVWRGTEDAYKRNTNFGHFVKTSKN